MKLIARLKVLLGAAPTYLAAAGVIIALLSDELGKLAPSGWQDNAIQALGVLAGIIAAATAIVRRVTPVLNKSEIGLLVPPPKADVDLGVYTLGSLLRAFALVAFVVVGLMGAGWIFHNAIHIFAWLGFGLAAWFGSGYCDRFPPRSNRQVNGV